MTTPNALPADRIMFLATGLAGSLLVNLSAQFPSANIADIQGGVAASADEASWILRIDAGQHELDRLRPGRSATVKLVSVGRTAVERDAAAPAAARRKGAS